MIDHPNQVTPQGLRDEAFHLSHTGRHHAAQVMRWAADKFEELEHPWRLIETAPKDGTEIVIFRSGWPWAPVAKWAEYPANPVLDESEQDCDMFGWLFDEWFTPGLEDGFLGWNEDIEDGCMPTHWMPLPTTTPSKPR